MIVFTALTIGFTIVFVALHYRRTIQINLTQKRGIQQVVAIKQLISYIQQHRGLSSAWLNGDESKQANLTQLKKQISLLKNATASQISASVKSRWEAFDDHWQRLQNTQNKTSALDNFQQHTKLIANLIYMLEDVAEFHDLNGSQLKPLPEIGLVWRELVLATENIGQSRAIGTGAATSKKCSQVDKIRLAYLQQDIANTAESVLHQLPLLDRSSNDYQQLTLAAKQKVSLLSETISNELIGGQVVNIDQTVYFNLATAAMDSLNQIFEYQINQVKQVLKLA